MFIFIVVPGHSPVNTFLLFSDSFFLAVSPYTPYTALDQRAVIIWCIYGVSLTLRHFYGIVDLVQGTQEILH